MYGQLYHSMYVHNKVSDESSMAAGVTGKIVDFEWELLKEKTGIVSL